MERVVFMECAMFELKTNPAVTRELLSRLAWLCIASRNTLIASFCGGAISACMEELNSDMEHVHRWNLCRDTLQAHLLLCENAENSGLCDIVLFHVKGVYKEMFNASIYVPSMPSGVLGLIAVALAMCAVVRSEESDFRSAMGKKALQHLREMGDVHTAALSRDWVAAWRYFRVLFDKDVVTTADTEVGIAALYELLIFDTESVVEVE